MIVNIRHNTWRTRHVLWREFDTLMTEMKAIAKAVGRSI